MGIASRLGSAAILALGIAAGCDSSSGSPWWVADAATDGSGGSSAGGTGGTSAAGTGGTSAGGTSAGGTSAGGAGGGTDPLDAARQACIDHINQLRATKSRAPYTRWTSAEACVDGEATYDSTNGPHAAFMAGNTCGASAQGECPGSGPDNVVGCIDLMWSEGDQSICSGCDACPSLNDGWNGNCPNCKVQTSSPTCGHYLALVVASQSTAACGFSSAGAYTAINYQ